MSSSNRVRSTRGVLHVLYRSTLAIDEKEGPTRCSHLAYFYRPKCLGAQPSDQITSPDPSTSTRGAGRYLGKECSVCKHSFACILYAVCLPACVLGRQGTHPPTHVTHHTCIAAFFPTGLANTTTRFSMLLLCFQCFCFCFQCIRFVFRGVLPCCIRQPPTSRSPRRAWR